MKARGCWPSSIVIMLIPVLVCTGTDAWAQVSTRHKIAEIVEAEARYDLFSGTVLVAKDGVIIYAGACGEENKEYHVPNVLETRFNISSVQKTFIATLIMQLYQEGKIDLDDPLTKYYPDCPYPTADQIRIRHLLNHTSGLGDYRDSDEYQLNSERYTCIDDVLPLVFQYEPAFAPGERSRYSNAGVLLLKGIIERVTGVKLNQALKERILDPLGMDNTTFYVGGDVLSRRATAYRLSGDGETYVRVLGEPSAYTGGGTYTTVLDLLKFDQAFYGEELLTEANKSIMFTPVEASPNYAYGWVVMEFGGTTMIGHNGGSGGFNSEFRRYPDRGYTIVVLSNYEDAAFELANKIDLMLLGMPYALASESDMYYRRGMAAQQQEAYEPALALFEKNVASAAPHLPSLYQCARTRLLGEFDQQKAIDLLDRYIALADETTRPSIAAAWWRKGIAHEQLGQTEQAITCHEKCLQLDEGWEEAKEALARLRGKE
ncbi:MAG TPA: serine hydrolase [Acidobacteriota bacterium]|nr:serine hydrolase [Acidobacteriota bacterium]